MLWFYLNVKQKRYILYKSNVGKRTLKLMDVGGTTTVKCKSVFSIGDIYAEGSIARWALPNENIPMHLRIDNDVQFDQIIVHLPEDFELVETINISDFNVFGTDVVICSTKKTKSFSGVFFGLVIKYTKIPKKLKISKDLAIEIIKNDKCLISCTMECRVFRPLLEIVNAPNKLILVDGNESNKIDLHLRYIGFGDISIEIQALIEGDIVSKEDSLVYEVILRLYERMSNEDKYVNDDMVGFKIEKDFVNDIITKVMKQVDSDELSTELLCDEEQHFINECLKFIKKNENYAQIIYDETSNILLSILEDVLERNPEENIELKGRHTYIKTKINAPVKVINLIITYTDILKNEYPTLEFAIDVEDKLLTHKDASIKIPIKIEKIDAEPFMNVRDMDVEANNK